MRKFVFLVFFCFLFSINANAFKVKVEGVIDDRVTEYQFTERIDKEEEIVDISILDDFFRFTDNLLNINLNASFNPNYNSLEQRWGIDGLANIHLQLSANIEITLIENLYHKYLQINNPHSI
ncbi:MAG: hypothetical protein SNJ70_00695 [Armatimonadota bacterium]